MTKVRYIICEKCGSKIRDQGYNANSPVYADMLRDETCWQCAFWNRVVSDKTRRLVVIDGTCYDFKPWVRPPYPANAVMGMNGKPLFILNMKGKVEKSNDAWLIGKVPPIFREWLPDNAIQITRTAYQKLKTRGIYCNDIGCLDRYKCLFFNKAKEEYIGPFNSVPDDWVEGNEFCTSFLSEGELKNFTPQIDSKQFHNLIKLRRV